MIEDWNGTGKSEVGECEVILMSWDKSDLKHLQLTLVPDFSHSCQPQRAQFLKGNVAWAEGFNL